MWHARCAGKVSLGTGEVGSANNAIWNYKNSTKICGVVGCGSNWAPPQNLLAFVAGSSTDAIGFSIANSGPRQCCCTDPRVAGNPTQPCGASRR